MGSRTVGGCSVALGRVHVAGLNLSAPEAVVACTSSSLGDLGLYECLLIAYALLACMDGDEARARCSDSDDSVASSVRACERAVFAMSERAGRAVEVAQLPEVYCEHSDVDTSDWGEPLNRFETVQFSFVS